MPCREKIILSLNQIQFSLSISESIDIHALHERTGNGGAEEQGQDTQPRLGDRLLLERNCSIAARRRRCRGARLRRGGGTRGLGRRDLSRGGRGQVVVAEGIVVLDAVAGQAAGEVAYRLLLRETVQAAVIVVRLDFGDLAAVVHHIGVVALGGDGAGGVGRGDLVERGDAVGGGGCGGHSSGGSGHCVCWLITDY